MSTSHESEFPESDPMTVDPANLGSVDPLSVEGLFLVALSKTGTERDAFLNTQCADSSQRQRVEALLLAYEQAGDFLQKPAVAQEPIPIGQYLAPCELPGTLGRLGPYEILEEIGRGGMGVVFRAHDPKLQRIVAVKALAPELARLPSARQRFLREARAAAAISHPHVVTIFAVEGTEEASLGTERTTLPFLVMECVVGQTLHDKIKRVGALKVEEIVRISRQIAEGLTAAHKRGLIHRDIKPANILLENGVERVKITDFGLARTTSDGGITHTGEILGTPQCMSPEQARGEIVDQRSDLFSLGCVMYTMCTGVSPFRADNILAVMKKVCEVHPRPVAQMNPNIPEWLCILVHQLLAKEPERRVQTAGDVVHVLETQSLKLGSTPAQPSPEPEPLKPCSNLSHAPTLSQWIRWHHWLPVVLLVSGLIGFVVGQNRYSYMIMLPIWSAVVWAVLSWLKLGLKINWSWINWRSAVGSVVVIFAGANLRVWMFDVIPRSNAMSAAENFLREHAGVFVLPLAAGIFWLLTKLMPWAFISTRAPVVQATAVSSRSPWSVLGWMLIAFFGVGLFGGLILAVAVIIQDFQARQAKPMELSRVVLETHAEKIGKVTVDGEEVRVKEILAQLQGTWDVDLDAAEDLPGTRGEVTIEGNLLTLWEIIPPQPGLTTETMRSEAGAMILKPGTAGPPQQIDLVIGPNDGYKRRETQGIIEITGETVKLCYDPQETKGEIQRPAAFASGKHADLLVLKRRQEATQVSELEGDWHLVTSFDDKGQQSELRPANWTFRGDQRSIVWPGGGYDCRIKVNPVEKTLWSYSKEEDGSFGQDYYELKGNQLIFRNEPGDSAYRVYERGHVRIPSVVPPVRPEQKLLWRSAIVEIAVHANDEAQRSDKERVIGSGIIISSDGKILSQLIVVKNGDLSKEKFKARFDDGSIVPLKFVEEAGQGWSVLQPEPPIDVNHYFKVSTAVVQQQDEVRVWGPDHSRTGGNSLALFANTVTALDRKYPALGIAVWQLRLGHNAVLGTPVLDADGDLLGVTITDTRDLVLAVPVAQLKALFPKTLGQLYDVQLKPDTRMPPPVEHLEYTETNPVATSTAEPNQADKTRWRSAVVDIVVYGKSDALGGGGERVLGRGVLVSENGLILTHLAGGWASSLDGWKILAKFDDGSQVHVSVAEEGGGGMLALQPKDAVAVNHYFPWSSTAYSVGDEVYVGQKIGLAFGKNKVIMTDRKIATGPSPAWQLEHQAEPDLLAGQPVLSSSGELVGLTLQGTGELVMAVPVAQLKALFPKSLGQLPAPVPNTAPGAAVPADLTNEEGEPKTEEPKPEVVPPPILVPGSVPGS